MSRICFIGDNHINPRKKNMTCFTQIFSGSFACSLIVQLDNIVKPRLKYQMRYVTSDSSDYLCSFRNQLSSNAARRHSDQVNRSVVRLSLRWIGKCTPVVVASHCAIAIWARHRIILWNTAHELIHSTWDIAIYLYTLIYYSYHSCPRDFKGCIFVNVITVLSNVWSYKILELFHELSLTYNGL